MFRNNLRNRRNLRMKIICEICSWDDQMTKHYWKVVTKRDYYTDEEDKVCVSPCGSVAEYIVSRMSVSFCVGLWLI